MSEIRQRTQLTAKAWEKAVQELGKQRPLKMHRLFTKGKQASATIFHKLQLVPNSAARIILGPPKIWPYIWRPKITSMAKCQTKTYGQWCSYDAQIILSKDCHLVICQINFQPELLFMEDRWDIEIVSMFHLVESMLANALFIIMA